MKARRPLTDTEEQRVIAVARAQSPRDRALVTTQLFTGFRIAEVLSLTIGQVWRHGKVLPQIGVAPRRLKGKRGQTRWVPVVPELERALALHVSVMESQAKGGLAQTQPLFASDVSGEPPRPLSSAQARKIFMRVFRLARVRNDGRLGTHTFRKTFARKVFILSGHNLHVTRAALGHTSIAVTERYLENRPGDIHRLVRLGDWTRQPRRKATIQ